MLFINISIINILLNYFIMKKNLTKSLSRIKKKNPELNKHKDTIKNLSAYEISIFRSLKSKYDLSISNISNDNIYSKKETELSNEAKKTLERINKGQKFEFPKE